MIYQILLLLIFLFSWAVKAKLRLCSIRGKCSQVKHHLYGEWFDDGMTPGL